MSGKEYSSKRGCGEGGCEEGSIKVERKPRTQREQMLKLEKVIWEQTVKFRRCF